MSPIGRWQQLGSVALRPGEQVAWACVLRNGRAWRLSHATDGTFRLTMTRAIMRDGAFRGAAWFCPELAMEEARAAGFEVPTWTGPPLSELARTG